MNPKIIQKEGLLLAGFSFFGNPFEEKDPWNEENEIGKLWRRLMAFIQQNASTVDRLAAQKDVFYEVHLSRVLHKSIPARHPMRRRGKLT